MHSISSKRLAEEIFIRDRNKKIKESTACWSARIEALNYIVFHELRPFWCRPGYQPTQGQLNPLREYDPEGEERRK